MTNSKWVVTFHFNRGQSQMVEFDDKHKAAEAVRIAVFSNEDCINCSIYKKEQRFNLEKSSAQSIINKM